MRRLTESEWTVEEARIAGMLREPLAKFREQRAAGRADPVLDFLFDYYAFRPKQLEQWTPGHNVILEGASTDKFDQRKYFTRFGDDAVGLDAAAFPARRIRSVRWIVDLLAATNRRAPFLGCNGMHEWAMVYGDERVRHGQIALRFDRKEINRIVDANPVACSHFDAFRFFTDDAKPLNVLQPSPERMTDLEQPGCLHANMDVYRWAGKLYPWVASDILADSFLLARRIREVDLRASPYDLTESGLEPIAVETASGKAIYRRYQLQFYEEGRQIRDRLCKTAKQLLVRLVAAKGSIEANGDPSE